MKLSNKAVFIHHNGRVFRIRKPQASRAHRRTRCTLLSLSFELRQHIYSLVVTNKALDWDVLTLRPPRLALVNRQLFHEVSAAFLEVNDFRLRVQIDHLAAPVIGSLTITPSTVSLLPFDQASFEEIKAFIATHVSSALMADNEVTKLYEKVRGEARHQDFLAWRKQTGIQDIKQGTSAGQSWLKILGPSLQIRNLRIAVIVLDPEEFLFAESTMMDTRHLSKIVAEGIVWWKHWLQPYAEKLSLDDGFHVAKQRVRDIVENVARREKPLGFTLEDVEIMVKTFDVREVIAAPRSSHLL